MDFDLDVLNERFSQKVMNDIKRDYKLYVSNSLPNKDSGHSSYISLAGLNGLEYPTFERKFISLCKKMKDVYKENVVFISLDDFLYAHPEIARNPNFINVNAYRGNLYINLYNLICNRVDMLKQIPPVYFIFYAQRKWFAIQSNTFTRKDISAFKSNFAMICADVASKINKLTGVANAPDTIDKNKVANTNNVKDYSEDKDKEEEDIKDDLVDAIAAAAENAEDEDEAMEILDSKKSIAKMIMDLDNSEYEGPKFSPNRIKRMDALKKGLEDKSINGMKVSDLLNSTDKNEEELPSTSLHINTPNEEWDDMKFINFNKEYVIEEDIASIIKCFSEKKYPVGVLNINVEDTSTSLDYIYTYRVEMEDINGKRFTLVFDMPKFINNRFMMLRGNPKIIAGQLVNLPCTKTNASTVQIVSNYNKITVEQYGSVGKSVASSDILLKALNKYLKGDNDIIKVNYGDNSIITKKYDVPLDYIDLASNINSIETPERTYIFNLDMMLNTFGDDLKRGCIPIGIAKKDKQLIQFNGSDYGEFNYDIAMFIADDLRATDPEFDKIYSKQKPARKHMYSRIKVLNAYIPTIAAICNKISFNEFLNKIKIPYRIETKRVQYDATKEGMIQFNDAYFLYELSPMASLLFNGLVDCNVDAYKIAEMNQKRTWVEILDNFGDPRFLADGLDNFAELFVDPITKEVCNDLKIPDDYVGLLLYANELLTDNAYIKHTNINGNRYRTTETIAGHLYKALATSYEEYMKNVKNGRKNQQMSVKRSCVIDLIFQNPVMSDLSVMTPLLEIENNYSASFKGLMGLNSDRAYGLDKRNYDQSMEGKIALSTGFDANVGINRQTTMDMDIRGKRGYINTTTPSEGEDDIPFTKKLAVTEGITPFSVNRDDPFRTAMNFRQTAKHSMLTDKSAPLLVTNGTEEAMTYMVSEEFVFRAKMDGTVKELVPNKYMIIDYGDFCDYIDLSERVKKNSDGGFFVTLQLTTDLKVGDKFKENDVIAYDNKAFSDKIGEADGLAYNVGVLAKVAILTTDEGFEDSTAISEWLSTAMGTTVVTQIPITLSCNMNIYQIAKVGQHIEEGEPLVTIQEGVSDKDIAVLLKNIGDEDFVSDLGKRSVKSKYTGTVQNIKIYRTCELEDMSSSLRRIVEDYEKEIKQKRKLYRDNKIMGASTLEPDYAMPRSGKLKNVDKGVVIEFYVKYTDTMGVGDKLTYQSANKGVVKNIITEGKEPYTKFRPDEKIHSIASSRSFNARMVTSPIVSGAINKGLIELDRQVKEIMGLKAKPIEDIQ